jgi:UDP-N-acetylmuramoyl-tripeptide--D-alanyl-D-alanine ligase
MIEFTLAEVISATGGLLLSGDPRQKLAGVSTDSRQVKPGELFIALKGYRFNGHDFLAAAAKSGAAALVIMEETSVADGIAVVKVRDTLKALGDLARYQRRRFTGPLIAITGSNGKTTTKDLIASVFERERSVVKTEANLNNEVGLPFTLFKITPQTQTVVVEMGMRGLGQIRQLTGIAEPSVGVITNVGFTHLELLKTQQNIARAKAELIEALPKNGLAILNGDDPFVRDMVHATKAKTVFYGIDGPDLDYRAGMIELNKTGSHFEVCFKNNILKLTLPIPGRHNIMNAIAAVAVAKELGVSDRAIQSGLAEPLLTGKRLHLIEKNGFQLIDDTYNASPTSVKAALDVLTSGEPGKRKIAVLADMLELGPTAAKIHYELGGYAAQAGIDYLFAYGELAKEYVSGMEKLIKDKAEFFSDKQALIDRLRAYIKPGDSILIKGSRGMKMEEIVNALSTEEAHIS